jgi:hypothetical protein
MSTHRADRIGRPAGLAVLPASALVVTLLVSTRSFALYGGYEHNLRDFLMDWDYCFDVAVLDLPVWQRDAIEEVAMRPGAANLYRFTFGSTRVDEALADQELDLEFELESPFSLRFRYFTGEAPDGRWGHVWGGFETALGAGWSAYVFGEPLGAKEHADVGLAFGHEQVDATGERIAHRIELRLVMPDMFFDSKNSINASHVTEPVDLQLSARLALGPRGWLSLDVDRDRPFVKRFGANPAAAAWEQDYDFAFDRFSMDLQAGMRLAGAPWRLWGRLRLEGSDRSRTYAAPGDPAWDWNARYDLGSVRVESWRSLASGSELGLGIYYIDLCETVEYPNDPENDRLYDRDETVLFFQYRKRYGRGTCLTSSVWLDYQDLSLDDSVDPPREAERLVTRVGLALEVPSRSADASACRFVLGGSVFLFQKFGYGGGYGQWVIVF